MFLGKLRRQHKPWSTNAEYQTHHDGDASWTICDLLTTTRRGLEFHALICGHYLTHKGLWVITRYTIRDNGEVLTDWDTDWQVNEFPDLLHAMEHPDHLIIHEDIDH